MTGETRIHLAYGREGLDVTIPRGVNLRVLDYRDVAPLDDPVAALATALQRPIASPPLAELARGKKRCCVVVSDKTRPVPNRLILPPIFEALAAAGVGEDRITILIGTGIHGPTTGAALAEALGEEIPRRVRVVNHDAKDPTRNVSIGRTSEGIEVFLDRIYAESDLKIVTGLIEPHFMAGYSGGRKGVCPAICSYDTVQHFHGVERLAHPRTATGALDGNPVHRMALEAARMAGVDFLVNVTLDAARRVTGVFAGDLEAAHEAGVEFLRSYAVATTPAPPDVVVTTGAGYPLDATFYQAVKGMVNGYEIVKAGGIVIVAAQCRDGEGSPEFVDLLDRMRSPAQAMALLRSPGFHQVDQWNLQEMCKVLEKCEVYFVCDAIAPQRLRRCGLHPFASVDEALRAALAKQGANAAVAVIPRGSYVEARVGG
jgi:nickel-dependent lactate racemase